DGLRKLADRWIGAHRADHRCLRIHRINRSLESIHHKCLQDAITNTGRLPRCANNGDRSRLEEPSQGRSREDTVTHLGEMNAGLGGKHGEVEFEVTTLELFRYWKSRMAEDVDHPAIVRLSDRPEARESCARGQKSQ